jgi:hypothetical protein
MGWRGREKERERGVESYPIPPPTVAICINFN